MTIRTALPKRTNQSLLTIKKKRFPVAVVIEPADRLSPAKQCVTDGLLHRLTRRITHPPRAPFLAITGPHDCFQSLSIALDDLMPPALLRLHLPLQMPPPYLDL